MLISSWSVCIQNTSSSSASLDSATSSCITPQIFTTLYTRNVDFCVQLAHRFFSLMDAVSLSSAALLGNTSSSPSLETSGAAASVAQGAGGGGVTMLNNGRQSATLQQMTYTSSAHAASTAAAPHQTQQTRDAAATVHANTLNTMQSFGASANGSSSAHADHMTTSASAVSAHTLAQLHQGLALLQQQVLTLCPGLLPAHVEAGRAYMTAGLYAEAVQCLHSALALHPQSAATLVLLAQVCGA